VGLLEPWGLCGNAGSGGTWSNWGLTWGRLGSRGFESGITDLFSVGHCRESGPSSGEYWRYLSTWVWGLDDLWCLIGKWKSGFI
jgi:hypothetical protein